MKKTVFIFTLLILSLFIFSPVNVNALSVNDAFVIGAKTTNIDDMTSGYNQEQTCTGSESVLGDPNDVNSVAWLLNKILTYATIIGMVLVVVLSSLDFLKAIVKSDDETVSKAKKKLVLRLILAALLFFVPTLTRAILDLFGLTAESTCGIGQ